MAQFQFLEKFDSETLSFAPQIDETELPGYDAGYQAGVHATEARQAQLTDTIVEKIVDLQFSQAEAQKGVLKSLGPLLSTVCNKILPEIADDVMRVQLLNILMEAAEKDISEEVAVRVNPTQVSGLEEIISSTSHLKAKVIADNSLGEFDVLIGHGAQETQLDIHSVIGSIQTALQAIIAVDERTEQHG